MWSAPCPTADGPDADLPEAQHQQASEGAHELSLPTARSRVGTPEPSLVRRHHLSADAPRVPLPRGDHGLAHPQGSVLADLEYT